MRRTHSFLVAAFLLQPGFSAAADAPGLPSYLTVGTVGNPLAAAPKLQVTFRINTTTPVGFALEVTANGAPVEQPDISLHVQCVADRPDWSCALGWWQNSDWDQYVAAEPDATEAFRWDAAQYGTEYCFRIRVFTPEDPSAQNWSKQACKQIPPVPPAPAPPLAVSDTFTPAAEQLFWRQSDFATIAAFVLEAHEKGADRWHPLDTPVPVNDRSEDQRASVKLSGMPSPFLALPDYRVCAINVSGRTCSLALRTPGTTDGPPTATPLPSDSVSEVTDSDAPIAATTANASATAVIQPAPVKPQARVKLDGAPASTPMSTCGNAAIAAARNSPAAPGLKQLCLARGGFLVLEPSLGAAYLETLAVQGGPIVDADPELSALRAQQSGVAGMRGFNIGVAATGHDTSPGPGKQHIYNSLARDERPGYATAVAFVLERNRR